MTLQLLPPDDDPPANALNAERRISVAIASVNPDGIGDRFDTAFAPFAQESGSSRLDRGPSFMGEKTETPDDPVSTGSIEVVANRQQKATTLTDPAGKVTAMNPLAGKALHYLIGADSAGEGHADQVTEVPYGAKPAKRGISIAYCNLFDELNTGRYGPYLNTSDTAREYNEGQIDPRGPGWARNLTEQFEQRKRQGFEYIELDNPDAYSIEDVIGAIELAAAYGLKVIAKNPGAMERGAIKYVAHPNVYGIIVEKGAGNAADMDGLRRKAGKPDLPVWFVAFGSGRSWAKSVASSAKNYRHMGVTYSTEGEYRNAQDVLVPVSAAPSAKI